MCELSLSEMAALQLVLEYTSIKSVLTNAMNNFATQTDIHSQGCADICSKAINTFLNKK